MMTIPMVLIGAYDSHSNMLNIDSVAWAYQTVQYPACLKINYTLGEAAGYPWNAMCSLVAKSCVCSSSHTL
jgi:hypothetical protein